MMSQPKQSVTTSKPSLSGVGGRRTCSICHEVVKCDAYQSMRTHLAVAHPEALRNMEERQASVALGRKGPAFRCDVCERRFDDLDWYWSHLLNDHKGGKAVDELGKQLAAAKLDSKKKDSDRK